MMHLSAEQFVHVLEGHAPVEVTAHIEGCEACRILLEEARAAWHTVAAVDVPEPSPLFWDHLSARIHAEIDQRPAQPTPSWRPWWPASWRSRAWGALATVVGVAVVATALTMRPSPPIVPDAQAARAIKPSPQSELTSVDAVDQQWELMIEVASDVELDHYALGLGTGPVDQAWEELSDEERGEVAAWLREALAASSPQGGTL